MSAILIQCPQTLQEVSVGLETDYRTFRSLPNIQSTMHCQACGAVHSWSPASAMLLDEVDRPNWVADVRQLTDDLDARRTVTRWAA